MIDRIGQLCENTEENGRAMTKANMGTTFGKEVADKYSENGYNFLGAVFSGITTDSDEETEAKGSEADTETDKLKKEVQEL